MVLLKKQSSLWSKEVCSLRNQGCGNNDMEQRRRGKMLTEPMTEKEMIEKGFRLLETALTYQADAKR